MADTKIETVQRIYEAFGSGDVPTILDAITDDVDFASVPDSTFAPWYGIRHNKTEVAGFFKALADNIEVTEFDVLAMASNDTDVMATIRFGLTVPDTGKSGTMLLHHWFRFDGDKIAFYRGSEDSAMTKELLGK